MDKWADYVISQVSYDSDHLISQAKRHKDTDIGIDRGKIVDRLTIISDIQNGLTYITVYSGISSWKKGNKINTFRIKGQPYLRIDQNKVKLDNLGDIPEVLFPELISTPEQPPKATPEQLARLEQLEKQIQELEQPPSPRGSLPKETTIELPQELDLAPEPIPEEATPEPIPEEATPEPIPEEATPEQLARLEQLTDIQNQIIELENVLSSTKTPSVTTEESEEIEKLEHDLEEVHVTNKENEILKTLLKQNEKLDFIEKKLRQINSPK